MGEQSKPRIEWLMGLLHRIEEHIEEWRKQERSREAEAMAERVRLWAEARERERLFG